MRKLFLSLVVLGSGFFFAGCSTHGSHNAAGIAKGGSRDVLLPQNVVQAGNQEYLPEFVAVLQKHGFHPVATGKARYTTELEVGGAFAVGARLVLLENGVPVAAANASNPGFGTWLARPIAKRNLFNSSLRRFDQELQNLQ